MTAAERTVEAKPDKAQPSSEQSHSEISREYQVKSNHFMNSSLFPEVSHQAWLLDTRGVSVLSSGSSVKAFRSRISFIIMSISKTSVILDYQDLRFENTIVKSSAVSIPFV